MSPPVMPEPTGTDRPVTAMSGVAGDCHLDAEGQYAEPEYAEPGHVTTEDIIN